MRIVVVVPRYGREVNGGAETLAREYATRLAERHEVTVLTTCALDYRTWADHFPPGESSEDGVRILRFPVPIPRDGAAFDALSARILTGVETGQEAEEAWMDAQGPNAPGLLDHLRVAGKTYDVVAFIPYLYATTVRGLPFVADRAALVPAFHDEPPLRLAIFDRVAETARALVFSTPEEKELARRRFRLSEERLHLVGAGTDVPPSADPARGAAAIGVTRPYAVCVGRIDPSKGSDDLIRAHRAYRRARPDGVDLVMLGRSVMDLPKDPWLVTPGFVDEQTKHDVIAGAVALVAPSPYESLSLVLLEAWSHGIPTVSSARSPILVGQTRRSGGGLWYRDPAEYAGCLDLLAGRPPLAGALGRAGWRFAQGLRWPVVIESLERVLEQGSPRWMSGQPETNATRSRQASTPPARGGPITIVVSPDALEVTRSGLHHAQRHVTLQVVSDDLQPDTPLVVLPRSIDEVLAARIAMADLVVTGDARLVEIACSVLPESRVVTPDAQRVDNALRSLAVALSARAS